MEDLTALRDLLQELDAAGKVRVQFASYDKYTGEVGEPRTLHIKPLLYDIQDALEKSACWTALVRTGRAIFQPEDPEMG